MSVHRISYATLLGAVGLLAAGCTRSRESKPIRLIDHFETATVLYISRPKAVENYEQVRALFLNVRGYEQTPVVLAR